MIVEMKDKKVNKAKHVRDYLAKHPTAKNSEIVEALADLGVNSHNVAQAKVDMKKKQMKKQVKKEQPSKAAKHFVHLSVEMGDGIVLLLTENKRSLGTLLIGPDGVAFVKSKGKKRPLNKVRFSTIAALQDNG